MPAISKSYLSKPRLERETIAAAAVLVLPALSIGLLAYFGYDMKLVLAGSVAVILMGLMFLQPQATTVLVLFVLYANLSVVAIRSYGVPEAVAASFFLLLVLPLLHYVIVDRQPVVIKPVFLMMLVYLAVALASAVASGNAARSVDRLLSYLLEGLVLYALIVNTVRTPGLLRAGIWALILAGMLMGSLSLYQGLTHSYDNDFGGLALTKETGTVDTGQVDVWGKNIEQQRVSGPVGSKNRYAQIMVVLLPLALMRIWAERNWLLRTLAAVACVPILGGALLTFSRGAGIAVVVTLLAMALLRTLKLRYLVIIALIGCIFVAVAIPSYLYRISTSVEAAELASGDAQQASGSVRGRATENLAALYIFLDHPILGVGAGQTSQYTSEYGNAVGYRRLAGDRRAHNMYFEELADTGIVGFSVFMGVVLLTLYQLFMMRRRWLHARPDIAYTAAGFLLAIIAFLVTGVFLHLSYIRYFWLILALAGAAIEIFSSTLPPAAPQVDSSANATAIRARLSGVEK